MRASRKLIVAPLLLALLCATPSAHESPVDHVDRTLKMWLADDSLYMSYTLELSERMALMQLREMDKNGNGVIEDAERDAFFADFALKLGKQLHVELDGKALEMKPHGAVALEPNFRQVCTYVAPVAGLSVGKHAGRFLDEYSRTYPGNFRWVNPKDEAAAKSAVIATEEPKIDAADGHPGVIALKFEAIVR